MEDWHMNDVTILITGAYGFLGSHTVRKFEQGLKNPKIIKISSKEFDLRNENQVKKIFKKYEHIDIVIHIAGDVGGIGYSKAYPGSQFYNNILMNSFILHYSYLNNVKKFIGIGSVCEYPEKTIVPFKEETVWDGYPVPTNDGYGLSKRALLAQSIAYRKQYDFNAIHLLPINLYGPGDDFNPKNSHVIPALIRKCIESKKQKKQSFSVWGSGKATREFLYVKDMAEAIFLATKYYNKINPINIGTGKEICIKDLAFLLKELINYSGDIRFDTSKPDGQMRRMLDTKNAEKEFGFKAKTDIRQGLEETIDFYQKKYTEKS